MNPGWSIYHAACLFIRDTPFSGGGSSFDRQRSYGGPGAGHTTQNLKRAYNRK